VPPTEIPLSESSPRPSAFSPKPGVVNNRP
jgi:hypothetical protein